MKEQNLIVGMQEGRIGMYMVIDGKLYSSFYNQRPENLFTQEEIDEVIATLTHQMKNTIKRKSGKLLIKEAEKIK